MNTRRAHCVLFGPPKGGGRVGRDGAGSSHMHNSLAGFGWRVIKP